MWVRILVGVSLSGASLGLGACGGSEGVTLTGRVVTAVQWKAVLRDWYDGRISDPHTCAAVVVASSHLPIDATYSTANADLARYAAKVCTHHPDLRAIKRGMTNADVAAVAGAPQLPATGRCWEYSQKSPRRQGPAVCFRAGRVVGLGSATAAAAPACDLSKLRATVGLQGATGSMLGGLSLRNPGPTCTLAGRPLVELTWHGTRVTPPQTSFDPSAFRSIGPFHASRMLGHGNSLFVWLQWWNYCGPKPWGSGGFRPVATLRVNGESGSVGTPFREEVVPPFCNSPKYARLSVSDFGRNP